MNSTEWSSALPPFHLAFAPFPPTLSHFAATSFNHLPSHDRPGVPWTGEFSVIMLVAVDASVPRIAEQLRESLTEIKGMQVRQQGKRHFPTGPEVPWKWVAFQFWEFKDLPRKPKVDLIQQGGLGQRAQGLRG